MRMQKDGATQLLDDLEDLDSADRDWDDHRRNRSGNNRS